MDVCAIPIQSDPPYTRPAQTGLYSLVQMQPGDWSGVIAGGTEQGQAQFSSSVESKDALSVHGHWAWLVVQASITGFHGEEQHPQLAACRAQHMQQSPVPPPRAHLAPQQAAAPHPPAAAQPATHQKTRTAPCSPPPPPGTLQRTRCQRCGRCCRHLSSRRPACRCRCTRSQRQAPHQQ